MPRSRRAPSPTQRCEIRKADRMNEHSVKHLELIQSVVTRMAQNSFALKGWAVTLVVAILALGAKESAKFLLVALLPAVIFWGLDGYYLRQERLFRRLYDAVRKASGSEGDLFSMDTSAYEQDVRGWLRTCWSTTIAWYYGPMVMAILVLARLVRP